MSSSMHQRSTRSLSRLAYTRQYLVLPIYMEELEVYAEIQAIRAMSVSDCVGDLRQRRFNPSFDN
jgi:hypothetical protein